MFKEESLSKQLVFRGFILFFFFGSLFLSSSEKSLQSWMCGPYTLCQVAERYGMVVDVENVAKLAGTTKAGTTMKGLAEAAFKLGMKAVGMKTKYNRLLELKTPLIAYVRTPNGSEANHFIVIDKLEANQLETWDVNQGYSILSREKFEEMWTGYVLTVSPPHRLKKTSDAPHIELDEPTYDFGLIGQMEDIQHDFTIKNSGGKPLKILKIEPSCTCEKVEIEDRIIPPGETTKLHVSYHSTTNRGKTRAAVYLTTNDPDAHRVVVSMFGIIAGIVGVYPGYFDLGEIGQEETIHKSFVVRRPEFGTLQVKKVKTSSPYIEARLEKLKDKDLLARVHFEIKPGMPMGRFKEETTIYTDAVKYPEVKVLIEGNVVGELLLKPNQFFMGFLKRGNSVRRTVNLEKRGKPDLKILKIEKDLQTVKIEIVTIEPGKKYQIKAMCTPTASSPALIRDVVKIQTNKLRVLGILLTCLLTWCCLTGLYNLRTVQRAVVWELRKRPFPNTVMRKSFKWLKENVPKNAVVAADWGIGSTITELGRRATIVDEEQNIPRILAMAKNFFCALNEKTALQFLHKYRVTHILLSSEDIAALNIYAYMASKSPDYAYALKLKPASEYHFQEWRFSPGKRSFAEDIQVGSIHLKREDYRIISISLPYSFKSHPVAKAPPKLMIRARDGQHEFQAKEVIIGEQSWYFPEGQLDGTLLCLGGVRDRTYRNHLTLYLSSESREWFATKLFLGEHGDHFKLIYKSDPADKPYVKIWEVHY